MANRVLRDCTDSDKVDTLTAEAERFFYRLMMKADDYGSFYANPKLLKAHLYPLKETLSTNEVASWLTECINADLVFLYQVNDKFYVRIKDFGQRLRNMRGKYPHPPTNDGELQTSDNNKPPETKQKQNPKQETETELRTSAPDFVRKDYNECYLKWMLYKKNRREKYKSIESEEAFYKKLFKLSGGNSQIATEIIEQSMAQNWAGIFELKNGTKQSNSESRERRVGEVDQLQNLSRGVLDKFKTENGGRGT